MSAGLRGYATSIMKILHTEVKVPELDQKKSKRKGIIASKNLDQNSLLKKAKTGGHY